MFEWYHFRLNTNGIVDEGTILPNELVVVKNTPEVFWAYSLVVSNIIAEK